MGHPQPMLGTGQRLIPTWPVAILTFVFDVAEGFVLMCNYTGKEVV